MASMSSSLRAVSITSRSATMSAHICGATLDEQDPEAYILDGREIWHGPVISSLEDVISFAIPGD
jgi:hypothetical protein